MIEKHKKSSKLAREELRWRHLNFMTVLCHEALELVLPELGLSLRRDLPPIVVVSGQLHNVGLLFLAFPELVLTFFDVLV